MAMTTGQHFTTGPALITWADLELGVAENGVEYSYQTYWADVHSDDFGGTGGMPSDVQFLGCTAMIQCILTKFIKANVEAMITMSAVPGLANEGTYPTMGSFVKQDGRADVLSIAGRNELKIFQVTFPRQPVSFGSSTRYRRYGVSFMALIEDACDMYLLDNSAGVDPCTGDVDHTGGGDGGSGGGYELSPGS